MKLSADMFKTITRATRMVYRESRKATLFVVLFYAAVYLLDVCATVSTQTLIGMASAAGSRDIVPMLIAVAFILISFVGIRLTGLANILLFNYMQREVGVSLMRKVYNRVGSSATVIL